MFVWSKDDLIVLLPVLVGIIIFSVVIGILFKNKSEKARSVPLMIITSTMIVLEVIKQITELSDGVYNFYTFPMHFCSLFLYFYPLACFAKGKIQAFGKTMAFASSAFMTLMFYFKPGTIIGETTTANVFANFSSFHTFVYHNFVILFFFMSIMLKFYNFNKWSLLHAVIGFSAYAIIAVPCAHLMNVNFCNLLVSNIDFMESLRLSVGQVWYTVVMYLVSIIGGILIVSVPLLIKKLNKRRIK